MTNWCARLKRRGINSFPEQLDPPVGFRPAAADPGVSQSLAERRSGAAVFPAAGRGGGGAGRRSGQYRRDPEQIQQGLNTAVLGSLPAVKMWRHRLLPVAMNSNANA